MPVPVETGLLGDSEGFVDVVSPGVFGPYLFSPHHRSEILSRAGSQP